MCRRHLAGRDPALHQRSRDFFISLLGYSSSCQDASSCSDAKDAKETRCRRIPYFNTVNIGLLSFPYPAIAARLADPLTAITDMGLVTTSSGVQLHQVRVQRNFPAGQDPSGALAAFCVTDYYLDPQSSLAMEVIDPTHALGNPAASFAHEIDFGNYAVVNGVNVPMTVSESVDGQMIWQAQLSGISFNVGLTDADFMLQ